MAPRLHSVRGGVGRRRQSEGSKSAESPQGIGPSGTNVRHGTSACQSVEAPISIAKCVCRNVCRSMPADADQCGPLVRASTDKTTVPHGGRCIQLPPSRLSERKSLTSTSDVGFSWSRPRPRSTGRRIVRLHHRGTGVDRHGLVHLLSNVRGSVARSYAVPPRRDGGGQRPY